MKAISCSSRGQAWLHAARYLLQDANKISDGWGAHNLIVEITRPGKPNPITEAAERAVDRHLQITERQPIHTVAETIFPAKEYQLHGSKGVFEIYPDEIYPAIRDYRPNICGTYIQRMLRRKLANGLEARPLESMVNKLRAQLNCRSPKKAVFELPVFEDATDIPVYAYESDARVIMGRQCLSHLSFKLGKEGLLYLTAIFRMQYFITKALGNFLGLARLQDFIAREVGLTAGPLVCHATYSKLELDGGSGVRWKRNELIDLVDSIETSVESKKNC